MYRILSVVPDRTACAYYRHILPAVQLAADLADRGIELTASPAFSGAREYDAYVFSRTPSMKVYPTIIRLYESGAKILWELDDDLVSIPEWSPVKYRFDEYELSYLAIGLRLASAVICSTRNLAAAVEADFPAAAGKARVCENLIDPRSYSPFADRDIQSIHPDPFRVLFSGSATHSGDMAPVVHLVGQILKTTNDYVFFHGYWPPHFVDVHPGRVARIGPCDKTSYEPLVSAIAPHVALCPLADEKFNRSKSAIKWMEMTLAGAAVIASNMSPFSDVITNGIDGYLCTHDWPSEWVERYRLLRDQGEWRRLVAHAREKVLSEFSWLSGNARRRAWLDFYSSVPDLPAA